MKIPFEIEGKTIKYTDTRGVVRKGFVVSVYNACDGPGGEAGMLFSGEYENLDVPESQIASFEIIDAELASYDESLKSRERSIVL